MDIGPKRLIVQRILGACLHKIRLHGEDREPAFQAAIADLPPRLRQWADQLESPSSDLEHRLEPSAFEGYALWAESYDRETNNAVIAGQLCKRPAGHKRGKYSFFRDFPQHTSEPSVFYHLPENNINFPVL